MGLQIGLVVRPPSDEAKLEELRAAVAALRREGHRVRVRVTFEAGDARRFARRAALCGADVVVAAGGDGTINEVVNGLMAADRDTALAIVPLGTANDFARMLDLPESVEACLRLAAEGQREWIDVASVNRRCFINVSTGGFGAAASRTASRATKRRLGPLAYFVSGAQKLMEFAPCQARFRVDGTVIHDGEFVFFAVGNARWTGGGSHVTPEADPGDGQLDVVVVTADSRLEFLSMLPELRAGTHLDDPDVKYVRARTVDVISTDELAVNADGERVAGRRFRYSLLERRLALMVPGSPDAVTG